MWAYLGARRYPFEPSAGGHVRRTVSAYSGGSVPPVPSDPPDNCKASWDKVDRHPDGQSLATPSARRVAELRDEECVELEGASQRGSSSVPRRRRWRAAGADGAVVLRAASTSLSADGYRRVPGAPGCLGTEAERAGKVCRLG